jgi:nitrite reductase/ring-hydroxylating ferredoxin subunit
MTMHPRPSALDRSTLDSLRSPQPEAKSMTPAMFIDPDVFRYESSVIFERSWLPVAHVSDLAEPGDYVATTIANEPIAVVRRSDGSLGAMANVCQHRNATILDGQGSVRAIQCPYHLWTYRLDGSLATAPDMSGSAFDPTTVCLPGYAVEEWRGFVFVNLDPAASSLVEALADLDAVVGDWGLERMVRTHTLSYPSPWNWKISVENALESYHHAGTHRHTLDSSFPGKRSSARDTSTTFVIAYNPPSSCVWLEVRPIAFDGSMFDLHVLVDPAADPDGSVAAFLAESLVEINAEDIDVNTRTWQGLHSRAAVAQYASPLEGLCWQFRRWLADHLDVGA